MGANPKLHMGGVVRWDEVGDIVTDDIISVESRVSNLESIVSQIDPSGSISVSDVTTIPIFGSAGITINWVSLGSIYSFWIAGYETGATYNFVNGNSILTPTQCPALSLYKGESIFETSDVIVYNSSISTFQESGFNVIFGISASGIHMYEAGVSSGTTITIPNGALFTFSKVLLLGG